MRTSWIFLWIVMVKCVLHCSSCPSGAPLTTNLQNKLLCMAFGAQGIPIVDSKSPSDPKFCSISGNHPNMSEKNLHQVKQ
jgi:hypothetical protein